MPTYTYRCTKCGSEFEAVQSMSDEPLKRCRNCRGALRRTFHPVGIVLKGSGFHRNDYRSKSAKSSGDGSKESSEKKESASTDKAEKSGEKSGEKPGDKKDSGTKKESSDTKAKSSSAD